MSDQDKAEALIARLQPGEVIRLGWDQGYYIARIGKDAEEILWLDDDEDLYMCLLDQLHLNRTLAYGPERWHWHLPPLEE